MAETRNIICISCPLGCALTVRLADGKVASIEGNSCKRGYAYGKAECENPTRLVTSTVMLSSGTVLPVKTASPIPKAKISAIMRALKNVQVDDKTKRGDIVVENICGTNVHIIATADAITEDVRCQNI